MRALTAVLVLTTLGCGSAESAPSAPPAEPAAPVDPVPAPAGEPVELPPPPPVELPTPAESASDGELEWRLTASSTTVTMAERAEWILRTEATNRSDAPVDFFEVGLASFTVNGEPSMSLAMAFANGGAPASWSALAPGETAAPARTGIGEGIFPAPGDYEIAMIRGGAVVGLTIHVVP